MKPFQWLTIGLAAILLPGCAPRAGETAPPTPATPSAQEGAGASKWHKDTLTITMIAKSANNPVFLSARTGAEQAATELSQKTGVNIVIDWRTPPTEDGQEQAKRLTDAVAAGTDVILLSCSDAAKVTSAINDAVAKGVPVMTFDSDAPDSDRFAFYGVDDVETGRMVMSELVQVTGGQANVAILAGNQNAPNLQKRVQGVREEAAKHPGIRIVDVFYHVESPQDATRAVTQAMQARPEISAWAMVGGWPLFATALLEDLDPAKVKVVAVDCLPAQLPYIEKGITPVLLAQPTYQWGYVSVGKIVDKMILGKEVPEVNKMELVRVTRDNLNEWAKQLHEWKFEGIDPRFLQ